MFDPTVFDNLKVIIEGYIYDLEAEGSVVLNGRSDVIDIATMSRHYSITYAKGTNNKQLATLELSMNQRQLAGELLRQLKSPGCHIKLVFYEQLQYEGQDEILMKKINKLWGLHEIKHSTTKEISSNIESYHFRYEVNFSTLFREGEEEIEGLLNLIDTSVSLLK
ncbi:hypothetical protein [Metabacillus malikii]|uniref:Uncharacterized protein n=1 Tax=Metabacillus malikii TaxID=1504265 RepID=A0ABT9ZB61_9BACI|nr:hypothetical protein [Metabacillus malikii]MDQ0228843.1 hypothetical protein [Metabacillus malikii]